MILSTDVRRKNLVMYDNRVFEIDTIAEEFPTLNTIEFGIGVVSWNKLEPIPLTEEWLLKFGLKQTFISKIHLHFIKGSFHLLKRVNHIQIWYENIDVKYVHQLQNLYFALTNQELTIQ